jgi:hypothetical protein
MSQRTDCKRGEHHFDAQLGVGAGLGRNVCQGCGAVAIHLTDQVSVTSVSSRLLGGRVDATITGDEQEMDLLTSPAFGHSSLF